MGLSTSKRVSRALCESSEFNLACDSEYDACLNLNQHAFAGVKPYQLFSASERLHRSLSLPILKKWVPTPPTRFQVDRAFQSLNVRDDNPDAVTLGRSEFRDFVIHLFTDAVVSNAEKVVVQSVPIGIAGIAGIGFVTNTGKRLIGTAIGAYALAVATSIYLSLS